MTNDKKINQSSEAAGLLKDSMSELDHEEMWALFLNGDNSLIAQEMLTKGTLAYTPIDSRTIIRRSLLNNAASIIIAHNHPSGNPSPSASDIMETEKVRNAYKQMDISLLDHIVITRHYYYSFADERTSQY